MTELGVALCLLLPIHTLKGRRDECYLVSEPLLLAPPSSLCLCPLLILYQAGGQTRRVSEGDGGLGQQDSLVGT